MSRKKGDGGMVNEIDFNLVGKVLEQDIISDKGVLLLKKGTVLTYSNILLLKKHNYKTVNVSENLSFKQCYMKHLNRVEDLFTNYKNLKEISLQKWFKEDQKIVSFIQKDATILETIYSIKKEDTLYRHCTNVGLLAFYLGKILRFSYKDKLELWQMGVLHDIGKMKLNPVLHIKREQVSKEQFVEYKKHPHYSWVLLKEVPDINVKILNAVRNHQERLNGSGFPRGLNVKYLHVTVQIISVADVIDELMSDNDHNIFSIINELELQTLENKLSPAVVVPFLRNTMRKHLGKQVRLSDDRDARIVFVFDHEPARPLIYFKDSNTFLDMRKFHNLKIIEFLTT